MCSVLECVDGAVFDWLSCFYHLYPLSNTFVYLVNLIIPS